MSDFYQVYHYELGTNALPKGKHCGVDEIKMLEIDMCLKLAFNIDVTQNYNLRIKNQDFF